MGGECSTDSGPLRRAWTPSEEYLATTHMAWLLLRAGIETYDAQHAWFVRHREAYWAGVIERLGPRFQEPYRELLDLSRGVDAPVRLVGAGHNPVESHVRGPVEAPAIVHQAEGGGLQAVSVGELEAPTDRVASGLVAWSLRPGDAVAVAMPMTEESVVHHLVQECGGTMRGVVPPLVEARRQSGCMDDLDGSGVEVIGSTGECFNADDMRWLREFEGGKPVIEDCGGTEVSGGFIAGTSTRQCAPGAFISPAPGLDFVILDDDRRPAEEGELFLEPPSTRPSTSVWNRDHDEVHDAGAPAGPLTRNWNNQTITIDGGWSRR